MRRFGAGAGAPISLILALVFPAMMAASVALAYYGYKHAGSLSRPIEELVREDSRAAADELVRTIEARLEKETQALFSSLAAARNDPSVPDPCDVAGTEAIDSYVVLHADRQTIECLWPRTGDEKRARAVWAGQLRRLAWSSLKTGRYAYEHTAGDGGSVLIAYTARGGEETPLYYVAARLDLDLVKRWLEAEVTKLRKNRRVAILDEHGAIAGTPIGRGNGPEEAIRFEDRFGKALYLWRIEMAPQNVEAFQTQEERKKIVQALLVILSTVIIAVGLGIVWLVVVAERRASRLKSDFIANVSHELKTPLSLIRMFGELVATGKHKGEGAAREYGGIITRESERLSHLIDNVLDFARLERGKASYHFAEGDVAEVLERALDVCRYRLEKEKLRLRTTVEPELPAVRMDDNAMTLVILNLVDNAMKYASDGGEVEVSLRRSPGGVVISVRDFGPGIPAEELGRIFERFYRAQNAREKNVRGSGIGLALVKHIAEAHGGRVTVESPPRLGGPGALFRVFLPAPVLDTALTMNDSAPLTI